VARCRDLGWVGDDVLAHDRARTLRRQGSGSLRIASELTERGLPEPLVEAAVEASLDGEAEIAWARRALARAGRAEADRPRAWRFLASRGFPEDVVLDLLGEP